MGKSFGIKIPSDCNFVYVFDTKKDFIDQVDSGQMKPLYGRDTSETEFVQTFMAYIPVTSQISSGK